MDEPTYTVWITTGEQALGGTDSNVFIMLYGEMGQTNWIFLPTEDIFAFEEGSVDKFMLVASGTMPAPTLAGTCRKCALNTWRAARRGRSPSIRGSVNKKPDDALYA